jgi:hypothetical protein
MKHTLILLLTSMILSSCYSPKGGYTVRGWISNGAGMIPGVLVVLGEDTVRTDLEGQFVFHNVKRGRKDLMTLVRYNNKYEKLTVHSDITLDTTIRDEYSLSNTIWFIQRHSTTNEPYMQQYLDFRRAIDSLPLVFVRDTSLDHYNVDSIPNANGVLDALQGLSIDNGWLLDMYYAGTDMGGFVMFYTRHEDEQKIPMNEKLKQPIYSLPPHIQVDFTTQGIWSAYQLSHSFSYLPKFWHAYYSECSGIFSLDEVRYRSPALRDSLTHMPDIQNRVEIVDADHAIVTAYWWNDWIGLFEETVFVERKGRSVNFIFPNRNNSDPRTSMRIIVPYDCGIMF